MSTDTKPRCSYGKSCLKQNDRDHIEKFSHKKSSIMCRNNNKKTGACDNPNCLYTHSVQKEQNNKYNKKLSPKSKCFDTDSADSGHNESSAESSSDSDKGKKHSTKSKNSTSTEL